MGSEAGQGGANPLADKPGVRIQFVSQRIVHSGSSTGDTVKLMPSLIHRAHLSPVERSDNLTRPDGLLVPDQA